VSLRMAHLLVTITALLTAQPRVLAQVIPSLRTHAAIEKTEAQPVEIPPPADSGAIYTAPTGQQKLRSFASDAFGPYAFASAVFAGGIQQAYDAPPEWGGGFHASTVRVASNFGIELVTTTVHYGLGAVFHEDIAYYRCRCTGMFPRLGHALISTVTASRGRDGRTVFSFSGLAAPYAGAMAALAWYPDRMGAKDGFRMGNYNLLGQAGQNLAFEFIFGGPHTLFGHSRHSLFSRRAPTTDPSP